MRIHGLTCVAAVVESDMMALPKKFPLVPALLLQLPAWLADTASWNGGWGRAEQGMIGRRISKFLSLFKPSRAVAKVGG
jgi:hypothetical protein